MRLWRRRQTTPTGPTAHETLAIAREAIAKVRTDLDEGIARAEALDRTRRTLIERDPESYREWCFRQCIPVTHEEYGEEPLEFVDWVLAYLGG